MAKRLFWRFFIAPPTWSGGRRFAIHYSPDQISGVMYAGVTAFGWSFLWSDQW